MFLWMIALLGTEIKVFNTDFLALFYQRCLLQSHFEMVKYNYDFQLVF